MTWAQKTIDPQDWYPELEDDYLDYPGDNDQLDCE